MIRKHIEEVPYEDVAMGGVQGTRIQWVYSRGDGASNFAMRRFTLEKGGRIPLHNHPWEHEIYFLKGRAEVFSDTERLAVSEGDTVFVPGDEPHGYDNLGDEDLVFLCMIPLTDDN